MRGGIAVIGIIVLVVGLLLISGWNDQRPTINEQSNKVEDEWNISSHFSKGDNLSLWFGQYGDWSYPYYFQEQYAGVMFDTKTFMVNITNVELNNYTLFKVMLVPPTRAYYEGALKPPYNFELQLIDITVTHHGAVTVEDKPDEVKGTIKNDGLYLVNCSLVPDIVIDEYLNHTKWYHPVGPPIELLLYKTTAGTERPYAFLLPLGILVSVAGATVLIWGAKSKRRRIARK